MVTQACQGLDVGPLVCDRSAVESFEVAVACDGPDRVLALIKRTARDADAGDIPRHYWTRLFTGGGYAARRAAVEAVDKAAARRVEVRETPVPKGEQQDMDFSKAADILTSMGWGENGLDDNVVPMRPTGTEGETK